MEIYVYGTGCGAGELIDSALSLERVTAFVDERPVSDSFLGRPVIQPEALAGERVDLLIVASRRTDRIESRLRELGVDPEKIFYLKNHVECVDRNRCDALAREVLGDDYVNQICGSERLIRVPLWTVREAVSGPESENDYVRLKTLEAISRRLENVPGAAAELGVYRGGFARWINRLLPGRVLYLFDTFEGFDETESAGYGAGFVGAHRNTAAEAVLAGLPLPERARTLVSLDADLEESTYSGLCWFLPRMEPGGYLLLHDYDNPKLPGVRRALERYEAERGRLCAVPLCDVNGTLVISV